MRALLATLLLVCSVPVAKARGPSPYPFANDHRAVFVSHELDPVRCQTRVCWDVTSASRQAISHMVFGHDGCHVTAASVRFGNGVWRNYDGSALAALHVTRDPRCGVGGLKFDDGFADGETRRLCLTYAGMKPLAERQTPVTFKAGTACLPTTLVAGPVCGGTASCEHPTCGQGVWSCPARGGPATCQANDATCGSCPGGELRNACGGCGILPGKVGDSCGGDACAPGFWECQGQAMACVPHPVKCAGGNECTEMVCVAGRCEARTSDAACAGGADLCSSTRCDAARGCVVTPRVCSDDGLACNGTERCDPATGQCRSFAPPCPEGQCDESTGKCFACPDQSTPNACGGCGPLLGVPGAMCGNACERGRWECAAGQVQCMGLTARVCDDGNRCTVDTCDPQTGCTTRPVSCSGDLCHEGRCDGATGQCVLTPLSCDDGDPCTLDSCHPRRGCVNEARTCDDGQYCNGRETCLASGGCLAGRAPCAGACDEGADRCVACLSASDCAPSSCATVACREGACVYDTNPVCECVGGIDLGLLVTHNLLTCGDYVGVSASGGSSDLQGRLAVAGDVTLRGFSVAALAPGPLALTVGGTWHLSDGTVHGDATYGVGADHQRVDFRGAVARGMPLDFAVECDDARKASTQVAALAANGTTTVMPWGVELTGGDARHNIFDLPIAALRPSMTFTVRTPSGASVIINVRGAGEATLSDFQIQFAVAGEGVPPGPRDVLWNFPEATRITITRFGVKGSLLAPRAAVAFDNAHIDGSMVARTVSGNGEYHHLLFRHTPPCPSRPR